MNKYYCIDCGKQVSTKNTKRCIFCSKKYKNVGKNNSNYIDGRCSKKYFCIDCGKQISYSAIRCSSCHTKTNGNRNYWTNYFINKVKESFLNG